MSGDETSDNSVIHHRSRLKRNCESFSIPLRQPEHCAICSTRAAVHILMLCFMPSACDVRDLPTGTLLGTAALGVRMSDSQVFRHQSNVDVFVGYPVKDLAPARAWYERLLGCKPTFFPNDAEAVWELAEHRYVYIKVLPEHAGHALSLTFLSDLDAFIAQIDARGIQSANRETLANGVRRVTYIDPDGNEIGFGGAPRGA